MYQQLKHFCIRYSICSYFYYYLFSFSHFIRASPIDLIYLIALTINWAICVSTVYMVTLHSLWLIDTISLATVILGPCVTAFLCMNFMIFLFPRPLSRLPFYIPVPPFRPDLSLSNRSVQWAEKLAYMSLSDPVPHSMNGWIIFTALWWSILYNIYTL